MLLKPSEIYYSQDSINNVFDRKSAHRGKCIGSTLDDLVEGRCSVADIPTITVCNKNGKWFTGDNRRLWIFKKLELLGKCKSINVNPHGYIATYKFTTDNGGVSIRVRGYPGGKWHSMTQSYECESSKSAALSRQLGVLEECFPANELNISLSKSESSTNIIYTRLDPDIVKYTKNSRIFTCETMFDHTCRSVQNLIDVLHTESDEPLPIPPIIVYKYKDEYWTTDGNRRLFAYKYVKKKVPSIRILAGVSEDGDKFLKEMQRINPLFTEADLYHLPCHSEAQSNYSVNQVYPSKNKYQSVCSSLQSKEHLGLQAIIKGISSLKLNDTPNNQHQNISSFTTSFIYPQDLIKEKRSDNRVKHDVGIGAPNTAYNYTHDPRQDPTYRSLYEEIKSNGQSSLSGPNIKETRQTLTETRHTSGRGTEMISSRPPRLVTVRRLSRQKLTETRHTSGRGTEVISSRPPRLVAVRRLSKQRENKTLSTTVGLETHCPVSIPPKVKSGRGTEMISSRPPRLVAVRRLTRQRVNKTVSSTVDLDSQCPVSISPKFKKNVMYVKPSNVEYTKENVRETMDSKKLFDLLHTLVFINEVTTITPITIHKFRGKYWATDGNKRLYAYKQAQKYIPNIRICATITEDEDEFINKMTEDQSWSYVIGILMI